MRKKRNRFLQFTSRAENGNTLSGNTAQAFPSSYTFHSLPLNLFIEQIESGEVDKGIFDNFFYTIRDKQQSYIKKLTNEINILESKYNCILFGIKTMEIGGRDDEMIKIIQTWIPISKDETFKMMYSRSKSLIQQADLKRTELERIVPKGEGVKADRDFFDFMIVEVSKQLKFQLDQFKTTVSIFARYINDMREQNERLSKINASRR